MNCIISRCLLESISQGEYNIIKNYTWRKNVKIAVFGGSREQKKYLEEVVSLWKPTELSFFCGDTNEQAIFKTEEYALLVSFDLAGFQLKTLTSNVWYNLLPCKQIHIITKINSCLETYLDNPLSISMFFFCISDQQKNSLITKYENIPWIRVLPFWQESPEKSLAQALNTVIDECHLI